MNERLTRRHALTIALCAACARCAARPGPSPDASTLDAHADAVIDAPRSLDARVEPAPDAFAASDALRDDSLDARPDHAGDAATSPIDARSACARGVAVGFASELPLGAGRVLAVERLIVARDEAGLFAMSATCTHSGCLVERDGEGYLCPCHSSKFSADGAVLVGPATRPLAHYALCVERDGALIVDVFEEVSPTTRAR